MPVDIQRACPVCGSSEPEPYLAKGSLRLVRCRNCSMVYGNPVPTEFASGEHYDRIGADYYLSRAKLESDYAPVRFERESRIFRQWCPRGAVLDVGCSSGAFLYHLGQQFPGEYELMGTDASGPALDYAASRGITVSRGQFAEQAFDREYDAVTFWAVLEHLIEPKSFLAKAHCILKPRGFCFVLVPNLRSLAVRFLGARYRYIYPQHLNYFTRQTLTELAGHGFSVHEIGGTHFNPVVLWQDWRRGGAGVSNQERAELLKRTTSMKQNPMLRPAKILYRLTEQVLGVLGLADNLVAVLQKRT